MPLFDAVTMPKKTNEDAGNSGNTQNAFQKALSEATNKPPTIGGKTLDQWKVELLGKTIGGDHSVTVYSEAALPDHARVWKPDSVGTMELKPERLNVHVDGKNIVHDVTQG